MNQDNNSDSFKSESDNLNATNVESLFSNNSENTSSNMQYTQNNNANAIETLGNINEENTSVEKVTIKTQLSKCGKVMMYIILVCTLLIVFDNLITSSDWYTNLYIYASINRNELVRTALKNLKELIEVVNWLLILVLTIINAIFFFKDKIQILFLKWPIHIQAVCIQGKKCKNSAVQSLGNHGVIILQSLCQIIACNIFRIIPDGCQGKDHPGIFRITVIT